MAKSRAKKKGRSASSKIRDLATKSTGPKGGATPKLAEAAVKGKVFKEVVLPGFGPTGGIQGGSYSANDIAQDIK